MTGTRAGYTTATTESAPTAAVTAGTLTTATPTITGTARVGQTLTANPGAWAPAPVTLRYQWLAGGVAISGATAATYVPASADTGKTIKVRVTGSKTGFASTYVTSAASAVVQGVLSTAVPTITGTAKVGQVVTANPGTWGPAPVTFTYQWYRDGAAITGSTAATRTVHANDVGKKLTVRVTGAKSGYASTSTTSAPTATVVP
ncbi:hypothetical protein C5B96_08970 [Subtercola sp. Z020]|uniref:hypothetical protein n=1 Tax=Subtercola sp. Z020 TaxID=2080582 RepID=UPI000CE913C5|nr:hypothetical protein [Subtercola sp. Z020]PPF82421.1 hypothetical protein C5B96_08970 [Subtercola sp. Z020]